MTDRPTAIPPPTMAHPFGFMARFMVLFGIMEYLYFQIPDSLLRDLFYQQGLATPCAAAINFLSAHEHVTATRGILQSRAVSLEIVRGCDGAGPLFLLTAAMLAFSVSWRHKISGIIVGVMLLILVNYIRIIGLYFVVRHHGIWFTLVHSYIVPTMIVVVGCVIFACWSTIGVRRIL